MEILPYSKKLLENFVYDGLEQELSGSQVNMIIEYYANLGPAFVGMVEDRIIIVGGMYPLWSGAVSAYLFVNKEAREHKIEVFKALLEYMNNLTKELNAQTLVVNCVDNILEAHTLLRHLGFIKNREIKMSLYTKKIGV
jgi:hypothetical protein